MIDTARAGSAQAGHPRPLISHGTPDALREFIAENLSLAQLQAQLGVTYAEIGDDIGLAYAVRRFVAYARQAVDTAADLKKLKAELAQRQIAAEGALELAEAVMARGLETIIDGAAP